MSIYDTFSTDKTLEKEGIVLDYGEFKFTVARAGGSNTQYQRLLEAKTKPYRRAIDTGTFDSKRSNQLMVEVFSEAVIKGWEGVTDREGKKLAFNQKNCVQVLTDLPDLFQDIMQQAQNMALYKETVKEDAAKN